MHLRSRLETGIWQLRSFRLLLSASMVSIFGSLITVTAFPFIAINSLGAGPAELALLSLAGIVPGALLGSIAGVWIERRSAKRVMIAADLISAVALLAVPLLWWIGGLSMALLLGVALVTSLARLGFRVADRSLLPRVVGKDQVESANAALSGGSALAEAGGFSLGGLLIQLLNGPLALLVDALSFLGSALLLARIRIDAPIVSEETEEAPRHWRTAIREGVQYLRHSPVLLPLAGSLFLQSAGMQAIGTVYFLFVNKSLGFEPGVLGVVFAVGGLGSLLGASMATRVTIRFGAGPALIGSLVLMASVTGLITLAQTAGLLALVIMIGQQLGDAFWIYYESTGTSLRQVRTPEAMLGRINGTFENIEFVGLLVGAGLGAAIGEWVGLRATILTGSGLVLLAALVLLRSPIRSIERLVAE